MEEEETLQSKQIVCLEKEGGSASKMSIYGEGEEEEENTLHHQFQSAESPVLSYVSLKSDRSMAEPLKFSDKAENFQLSIFSISENERKSAVHNQAQRAASPVPSYVSVKSDRSMAEPLKFSDKGRPFQPSIFSISECERKSAVHNQAQRAASPVPSYVSVKSDRSMAEPLKFSDKGGQFQTSIPEREGENAVLDHFQRAASPVPSYVSLKSDRSMAEPLKFCEKAGHSQPSISKKERERAASPLPSYMSLKSDRSMAEPLKFRNKAGPFHPSGTKEQVVQDLFRCPSEDCDCLQCSNKSGICSVTHSHIVESSFVGGAHCHPVAADVVYDVCCGMQLEDVEPCVTSTHALEVTGDLHEDSYKPVDDSLQNVKENHKKSMKNKYESLFEGINIQQHKTLLNKIYTQLYIIEGETEGVNEEHEVVQIEKAKTERLQGTPINCNYIFQPISELSYKRERKDEKEKIKTVLTKGIAGIGKTVSVQKFILDWAEGKANQDVDFIFFLPFRELNLVKDDQYNLHRLLLDFHPKLLELDSKMYDLCKVLFIFDGLDESRITLNFSDSEKVSDVFTTSSLCALMSNLIKGELLPSALIWITSRPAAANQIPSQYISRVTEVQGFNDPQKVEYFRKRISDQDQASKIILHIRKTRSLHIMCHIPVFCWISASVLQKILEQDHGAEIPKTLTEMYIHFLIIQTNMKIQKYDERDERNGKDPKLLLQSDTDMILKLAELAFKALIKGNVLFYDEDLRESGIDVNEASVYSGICTEIFGAESVIYSRKVYGFVHLSFQEFFAALHAFSSYLHKNTDVLKMFHKKKRREKYKSQSEGVPLDVFLKDVVDEALKSKNGHLDLFLRFLHGITLESNQRLLKGLLTRMENNPESIKKVIKNLKQSQKQDVKPERWINLSHCLLEMKDSSILEDIQAFLKSEAKSKKYLSPAHCSALANMLLISEDVFEELNLKKYNTTSTEAQRRLVPAVRNCRKALLAGCNLTEQSCEIVASALQSTNSPVRELDMSNNDLQDSGVELLSFGITSSHCKLKILRLKCCKLTMLSCKYVASALLSANSFLSELDLSNNELHQSGLELLTSGLKSTKLEILRLSGCKLSAQSCETVASVLQSVNSYLRELDLSNNDLQDPGVKQLSTGLSSTHCKLKNLRLASCKLTDQSCKILASILQSVNCLLIELDLSNNGLQDLGVKLLSAGLKSPNCKLGILRMAICNLTHLSCKTVATVLQSANSLLRELNLSKNHLQDSGVELLSDGLKSSHCKLEILRLSGCIITDKGFSVLAEALSSNPSHLKELDLSCNHPGDIGHVLLSARLEDPTCKLEILNVEHEGKFRIAAGFRRYTCELTLDPNTAHTHLSLSEENKKVTHAEKQQSYPDHPERFECFPQVLCRESLCRRCSWEVEWSGKCGAYVSLSYKEIKRKGESTDCEFGSNEKSWRLICSDNSFTAWHNNERTKIRPPSSSSRSKRVGVYLDWPVGTLSFYSISSTHRVTHLHTFNSTFSEPLYAGFGLYSGSSVSLLSVSEVSC
ncbi:NACHT, LRR and PYD domains-containing protein 12 isoform X3 [Xyrauchen texanus]|uniref:NACHT, LRR and PYD domains-containing protein 12 isoform X3 n=1 Tax=Xyrauchen texanus TaxID=154827 RepID=UPI0022423D6A|nr:NACHT, LRR and PYD domains-containing protein 12 isoform X3 [Xyrauchen texanus]